MTVLQSIFPPARRRIEAAEFSGLERLSVDQNNHLSGLEDESIKLWNLLIGIQPAQLVAMAEFNFGEPLDISVGLNDFHADIYFKPAGDDYFEGGITFGVSGVSDTQMSVDTEAQGRGYGNAWLKTCIELLHAVGHQKFPISAGLENGAYSWGRAGAYLQKDPSTAADRIFVSNELLSTLESVSFAIPRGDYHKAKVFARLTNKDDLARLCDLQTPVDLAPERDLPKVTQNLESFLAANKLNPDPVSVTVRRAQDRIMHVFERASAQEKIVTLPRLLLTRTLLDVVFDFNDAKQMERAGARLGGWEHIAPV